MKFISTLFPILIKILPIFWLMSFILPFVLLPLKWALASLFLVFIGAFPISFIVLAITKPIFYKNSKIIDLIDGSVEVIFYFLISLLSNLPANFLIVLIVLYIFNQLNRMFRNGQFDKREYYVLVGFIVTLLILLLLNTFISIL